MIIQKLHIENFRAFTSLDIRFSEQFNIIVGDNMSGKTAILEALNVGIGSFLLGIDGVSRVHIQKENIRLIPYEKSSEYQLPVIVECIGEVDNQNISWKRELTGENNRTKYIDAREIKEIATALQKKVRKGSKTLLPLIAYFPIDSVWKDNNLSTLALYEKRNRTAGYENSLNATYNYRNFALWLKSIQLSNLQSGKFEIELKVINNAVTNCIENCQEIYFDFALREVVIRLNDGRIIPFTQLSSGFKKMMAIITDLAFRCIILNPYLGEDVLRHISGVVLIDEIDAHLHPSWQRKIVPRLKSTFPKLQFIVTTHSPHVVASANKNEVIALPKLSDNMNISPIAETFKGWQIDYILRDILESKESTNEIDINPILDKLDIAFATENISIYEQAMNELESILHPNDPILVVYKLKKSRFSTVYDTNN